MKRPYYLIITALFLVPVISAHAQNNGDNDFSNLIKSSADNATKLVHAYGSPLFKGFGIGLNSGWNNTAKTKKFLHFDVRLTVTGAQIPESERSFDVTQVGLSRNLSPADPTKKIAPTFGGDGNTMGPVMSINDNNGTPTGRTFTMPSGVFRYVPAPAVQVTIGILQNTDLTVRGAPTIKLGDNGGSINTIGFGLKHDIIQDFAKDIPKPFDLAIAVNYNRINYSKTLSVQPDAGTTAAPGSSTNFSDQRIDAHFSGVNVQAILSKKLAAFTPFVSVAYQSATTDLGVLGNFPFTATSTTYVSIADPVHINETSVSGMRVDAGFQLNLAILRVYASVAACSGYAAGNVGLGFGF